MKTHGKIPVLALAALLALGTAAYAEETAGTGESGVSVTVKSAEHGSVTAAYEDGDAKRAVITGSASVPAGTELIVSATPHAGYRATSIRTEVGGTEAAVPARPDGDSLEATVAAAADMTVSAAFEPKETAGDRASVRSYRLDAVYANSTYYYHKEKNNGELMKQFVVYEKDAGGRSEITHGNYVDLTLFVSDPEAAGIEKEEFKKVSVSTPGGSVLRLSEHSDKPEVSKTASGEYTVVLKGLLYSGQEGHLEILVSGGRYNARLSAEIKNLTKDPPPPEPDPEPEQPTDAAKPYIIIRGYSYGGTDLIAGESRNVTMTFYNTSRTLAAENMMVTMDLPADAMVLTSSSNSFYVERLAPEASITKTVNVTVKPTAPVESKAMTVSFTYDYIDGEVRKSTQTEESISMPIQQVDRFTVTGLELEPQIFAGQEAYLSVGYVNKGRSDVFNISAKLVCEGAQNNGEEQYIGNLGSGTENTADFYIIPIAEGTIGGEVVISYEDTNMAEREIKVPFSATVVSAEDPGAADPANPDAPAPETPDGGPGGGGSGGGFPWLWTAAGAAAAAAAAAVAVIRKRRKQKENVDEDEDF